MPSYAYQCYSCGLQFDKISTPEKVKNLEPCPDCGAEAKITLSDFSYGFDISLTNEGPVPQNTGVSSFDTDFDRIVSKDSHEKWEQVNKRQARKREVMRDTGSKRENLALTPDGDYVPVSSEIKEDISTIRDNTDNFLRNRRDPNQSKQWFREMKHRLKGGYKK